MSGGPWSELWDSPTLEPCLTPPPSPYIPGAAAWCR